MLRPKTLKQVLQQATTGAVTKCLLFKVDGALLIFSGDSHKEAQVTAAIASNIWSSYQVPNDTMVDTGAMQQVMIDCEDGRLVITKVAGMLLCIAADTSAGFGLLKAKAEALVAFLDEPLSKVPME